MVQATEPDAPDTEPNAPGIAYKKALVARRVLLAKVIISPLLGGLAVFRAMRLAWGLVKQQPGSIADAGGVAVAVIDVGCASVLGGGM